MQYKREYPFLSGESEEGVIRCLETVVELFDFRHHLDNERRVREGKRELPPIVVQAVTYHPNPGSIGFPWTGTAVILIPTEADAVPARVTLGWFHQFLSSRTNPTS